MILGYTEQVLSQLKTRVDAWGPHQVLGDIFLQLVRLLNNLFVIEARFAFALSHLLRLTQGFFLKIYTQYVTNYDRARRDLIEFKKKSSSFAQFLDV